MSMPLKEFLIKKLSLKSNTSERIIEAVISNQFSSAFQATATHNSIELSGFGKFVFSMKRANRTMDKYIMNKEFYEAAKGNPDLSPSQITNLDKRLATTVKNMEHLKPKIDHGTKTDI